MSNGKDIPLMSMSQMVKKLEEKVIENPIIMITADEVGHVDKETINADVPTPITNKYLVLTNLNKSFVIVKRHNGNTFFKRKGYITCLKNYPRQDCIYTDEVKVKEEVAMLNASRKKCKYFYENASKYFVNDYNSSSWGNKRISNKAIPIKEVTQNTRLTKLTEAKESLLEYVQRDVKSFNDTILAKQNELPLAIERLKREFEESIGYWAKQKAESEQILSDLLSIDTDKVMKEYETQGDRLVKVLYKKG